MYPIIPWVSNDNSTEIRQASLNIYKQFHDAWHRQNEYADI